MQTTASDRVGELYARFGPTIYARCRRMLKERAAAEDATQEVFMKVLRHIDSAPSEDAVLPWIHRITTNHCLNLIRDGKRRTDATCSVPEADVEDFEDSVVTRDFAHRFLEQTPPELRIPAVLYHVKGMEQARVARSLGVSRRTILYRLAAFTESARRLYAQAEAGLA